MSTNNDQDAGSLPDPQTAYNTLFNGVHAEAFFGKLAQHGIEPANEKEAQDLLELAGKLRAVDQEPAVKRAAQSRFAQASIDLDNVLAANGLDGGVKRAAAVERDAAIRNVAGRLAADPDIYNSVLSLKAAEAAAIAQEIAA